MMIYRAILILLVMAVPEPSVLAQDNKPVAPPQREQPRLAEGQVWSYKTRPGEEGSTFTVLRVEQYPGLGRVVHIAVRGVRLKGMRHEADGTNTIRHMPFAEEAVVRSAVKLLKEDVTLPGFEEGYEMWRAAFLEKRAGVYKVTIAEAVAVAERTFSGQ